MDAITEKIGVNIFDEKGNLFYQRAIVSTRNNSRHTYGATFGVPKTLRVQWRDKYVPDEIPDPAYRGGTILGDYTVPVAPRIPDELLNALRKRGGLFRLKIRIHEDGPLIGWDIHSGGQPYYAGGDFQEAHVVSPKATPGNPPFDEKKAGSSTRRLTRKSRRIFEPRRRAGDP